jgi:hypothetical protein
LEYKDFIKAEFLNYLNDEPENLILITSSSLGKENKIYLDKSTAIKFAKTLRTEINKITESEVNNG